MKYFDIRFYENVDINWPSIGKIPSNRLQNDISFSWSENAWCSWITINTEIVELFTEQNIRQWNYVKVFVYDNKKEINWQEIYRWYLTKITEKRKVTKDKRYDTLELEILHISFLFWQSIINVGSWDRTLLWHVNAILSSLDSIYPWVFSLWTVDDYKNWWWTDITFSIDLWNSTSQENINTVAEITWYKRSLSPTWKLSFRSQQPQQADYTINEWTMIQQIDNTSDWFYIKNKLLLTVRQFSSWTPFPRRYTFTDSTSVSQYWEKAEVVDLFNSTFFGTLTQANEYAQDYADKFFDSNTRNARTVNITVNDVFFIYQLQVGDYISIINTDLDIKQIQVTNIEYSPTISKITVWRVFTAGNALLWQ